MRFRVFSIDCDFAVALSALPFYGDCVANGLVGSTSSDCPMVNNAIFWRRYAVSFGLRGTDGGKVRGRGFGFVRTRIVFCIFE